jgi:hypothetical protein
MLADYTFACLNESKKFPFYQINPRDKEIRQIKRTNNYLNKKVQQFS